MLSTINQLDSLFDAALALIYPQACVICGVSVENRRDGIACDTCWRETRLFDQDATLCWKCGVFIHAMAELERRESIRCGRCENEPFAAARAGGFYEGALRASILNLKREPHVAARLVRLLRSVQQREPLNRADLIIPVPLHPDREHERGFNQATVLARELSRLSDVSLEEHAVVRSVHTDRHRAGMDHHARRKSVDSAFAVRHPDLIKGRRVLLVDDVFTTGATVSSCAAALLKAEAAEVFVLTIARA